MIISSFHPVIGGAERQAQQLAARLVKKDVSVHILTRRYKGLKGYEGIDGVPVHRVPTIGKGALASLSYTFFSLLWLFRNRDKHRIVHCHQALSPTTIGVLSKFLFKKKIIVKIAGSDLGQIYTLPLQSIRKRLLSKVDVFIAINDTIRKGLVDLGLGNVTIKSIPNGVDVEKFAPVSFESRISLRERFALPQNGKTLIFAGRLHSVKGLDTLLQACSKALPTLPKAQLLILGEGPEESSLKNLASRLRITDSVLFLGRRDNVVEYLQSADVFILPSMSEGLSNSLLEAMACGLAVVATDVGGNVEAITHGCNGILVPPRDPAQLAQALIHLIDNSTLATELGEQARITVEKNYSLSSVVDQYVDLYQQLLKTSEV